VKLRSKRRIQMRVIRFGGELQRDGGVQTGEFELETLSWTEGRYILEIPYIQTIKCQKLQMQDVELN